MLRPAKALCFFAKSLELDGKKRMGGKKKLFQRNKGHQIDLY